MGFRKSQIRNYSDTMIHISWLWKTLCTGGVKKYASLFRMKLKIIQQKYSTGCWDEQLG